MSTWHICLTEILKEKHLKLSDYLDQIQGPLATSIALHHFGFLWTLDAKAAHLQDLPGCFRPRLPLEAQNRASAKNGCWSQILDTAI